MHDRDRERAEGVPELPAGARRTAEELAELVPRVTRDLPFGAEPLDLLAALERLAVAEERR
jgi:hypothetical protein